MRWPLFLVVLLFPLTVCAQNDSIVKRGKKFVYKGQDKLFRTRFDSIRNFCEGRAAAKLDDQWYFIDESGKFISNGYYQVKDFHGGLAAVKSRPGQGWNLINIHGDFQGNYQYESVVYFDSLTLGRRSRYGHSKDSTFDIYHFSHQGRAFDGVFDIERHGQYYVLVYIDNFCGSKNHRSVQIVDRKCNSFTPKIVRPDSLFLRTNIVTDCRYYKAVLTADLRISKWYNKIDAAKNGYYTVYGNNFKIGLISERYLFEIIPPEYDFIERQGDCFIVRKDNSSILLDTLGQVRSIPYHRINYLGCDRYAAQNKYDNNEHIITGTGQVFPETYADVFTYNGGIARVISTDSTKFAYVDTSGYLISQWYERGHVYYEYTSGGMVDDIMFRIMAGIVTLGISEIFLNNSASSTPVTHRGYYSYYGNDFNNGYGVYTVRKKESGSNPYNESHVLCGVIDSSGKIVLEAKYERVVVSDTFVIITKNGKDGIITLSGKQVLPCNYDRIDGIGNGFFSVRNDYYQHALYRVDGKRGKFVTGYKYDGFLYGGDSAIIVKQGARYGYMDYNGKLFTPIIYYTAEPFINGKAKVSVSIRDDQEYFITPKGSKVQ